MRKIFLTTILVGAMLLIPISASASVDAVVLGIKGWYYERETSQWNYYVNGAKVINGVIQDKGLLYYFDKDGNLENGTHTYNGSTVTFENGLIVW